MRLWSLHPAYLDAKGLVALWREGLLAQKVLQGKTKGYRNHPQLERFKEHPRPEAAMASYLHEVHLESKRRGYSFDGSKVAPLRTRQKISVTKGQLEYELRWLARKLKLRDRRHLKTLDLKRPPKPHPTFKPIAGKIASWEKRVL